MALLRRPRKKPLLPLLLDKGPPDTQIPTQSQLHASCTSALQLASAIGSLRLRAPGTDTSSPPTFWLFTLYFRAHLQPLFFPFPEPPKPPSPTAQIHLSYSLSWTLNLSCTFSSFLERCLSCFCLVTLYKSLLCHTWQSWPSPHHTPFISFHPHLNLREDSLTHFSSHSPT